MIDYFHDIKNDNDNKMTWRYNGQYCVKMKYIYFRQLYILDALLFDFKQFKVELMNFYQYERLEYVLNDIKKELGANANSHFPHDNFGLAAQAEQVIMEICRMRKLSETALRTIDLTEFAPTLELLETVIRQQF